MNTFNNYSTFSTTGSTYFVNKTTAPEPPKYKANKANDIKICVTGSVDGVKIADTIVQITITYLHAESIRLPETIPKIPRTTCTMGT